MLFRRALTEKIGMLDESFGTGNFEDAEFCIRAVLAGHKNYIAGDVFIHHYGGRSFLGNKIGRGKTTSGNRWFLEKKLTLNYRSEAGKKIAVLNAIETADYFYQKGNIDQAVDALIGCLEVSRNAKEIYHEIARISIETKRFSEAWESIETMPEAAKNDLKSLEYAGYAKEGLGLDHEADVYAERMFTKNQNYPAGLNLKGGLAYKKGEKEKAAEYFKKAIDADPGYGEAHTNLGVLYWSIDKKDEALAYLRKGFVLSPTVPDTSSLYYSAVSSLATHRDAEVDFREACRFYPNNRNLAFIYIDTLIQQEKFDLAMPKLEDALAMFGIDEGTVKAALVVREKIGPLQIEKAAKKRTLSLCMTAKNEEPHIVRQLKSVRDVLDEIVVVNTGSTDRTIDIVRAFGAKVLEFSGTEDLSQARNYALLQSAGDWILIPDTGEILSAHDVEQLKAIIRKNSSSLPADSRYHNKLYKRGNAAGSTIRL
jgi:tetratricopeptide (TPR) repeat protein